MIESPRISSSRPVTVLFGPQCFAIDESLSLIRNSLRANPSLKFLETVLEELPSLWPAITDAWPALLQIPGAAQLGALAQISQDEPIRIPEDPMNVLFTPVTVLRQIIEFWTFKEDWNDNYRVVDTQGFCVGFLAAVVVSCSQSTNEFQEIASVMVRLSVCIGAVVDLDALVNGPARSIAVRWKVSSGNEKLNQVLLGSATGYMSCSTDTNSATITVADGEVDDMMKELRNHGLSAKLIHLRGRFHHAAYATTITRLSKLCEGDARFRLPSNISSYTPCFLPLRSNVDGDIIGKGSSIHDVVLESILAKPSLWSLTVSAAFDKTQEMLGEDLGFIAIGTGHFVPRLIRDRLVKPIDLQNHATKEHHGAPNGYNNVSDQTETERPNSQNTISRSASAIPIAITGMGCRYSQAEHPEHLWEMLQEGQCAVSPLPNKRFKMNELSRQPKGPFFGNYLDNPDVFDHRFFGISAREAEAMDPQQRLLLQVSYEAMESAGYCGLKKSDLPTDIGCYVGVGSDDYTDNIGSTDANAFSATGTLQAFNSGRISHYFGWSGPSLVVDTACSSAAVAIHLACKALQNNECSIAVAGGVNIMTSPRVTQNLAAASFLSRTGASKAFDQNADGYCRGEGAGLVVLRPLADALRSGDPILAVIGGSAVNQGSNRSPITVPHSESQVSLYRKALAAAGVSPEEVTYVEAHGTGTQVGDPIEFDSLRETFSGLTRRDQLYVGSIKDNIGHTETASGVAGLLKVVLMMQKGQIPKQANFSQLNPKIPQLKNDPITIPTQLTEWSSAASSMNAIAMVTNYGAAGSNAAIIVKQYRQSPSPSDQSCLLPSEVPIILAASSADSLRSYCKALTSQVRNGPVRNCVDMAYNLAVKQSRDQDYIQTFTVPSDDPAAFLTKLESVSQQVSLPKKHSHSRLPVILCFGGQNGNTAHISEELFNRCELLQYHLMECEKICQALELPTLFPDIFDPAPIDDIISLHCILFVIQFALAKSWLDSGLQVDRIIGHSFGQLTGLCVSGGIELFDALYLISERARLIRDQWGSERGVMLSVEATTTEVQHLLSCARDITVDVACVNGERNTILAGNEPSILAFEKLATQNPSFTLRTRRLQNTHAFHSRLVDNIVPDLTEVAHAIRYLPLSIPLEACSEDGDWSSVNPTKIVEHSRNPVHFQAAVERAVIKAQGPAIWLEAGSASPVISMVRRVVEASKSSPSGHVYQSIDLGNSAAQKALSQATCNLWSNNLPVQFWPFHTSQAKIYNWINLPPYQFAQNRHWINYDPFAFAPSQVITPSFTPRNGSEGFVRVLSNDSIECLCVINTKDPLYQMCTSGHAVVDQNLCPASLYIEMVVRAACLIRSENSPSSAMPHIQNMAISAPLVLNPRGEVLLKLSQTRPGHSLWSFSLFTRDLDKIITHATGEISLHPFDRPNLLSTRLRSMNRLINASRVHAIEDSSASSGLKGLAVYQAFRRVVNYSECYRGVERVYATEHEAAGVVNLTSSPTHDSVCDPVLLDNFIQVAGIHVNCLSEIRKEEVFVCTEIGEILIDEGFLNRAGPSSHSWVIYSNLDRSLKNSITCDIFVLNRTTGKLAVTILAVVFKGIPIISLTKALKGLNSQPSEQKLEENTTIPYGYPKETVHVMAKNAVRPGSMPQQTMPEHNDFADVQTMLCDLLGMPSEDILPSSNLEDIGVDSLMRTELLAEIKKRFKMSITPSSLADIPDVQTLMHSIFSDTSTTPPTKRYDTPLQIGTIPQIPSENDDPINKTSSSIEGSHDLMDIAPVLFSQIQRTKVHSKDAKWDGFYESVYSKQMELVTTYILEAFRSLGVSLENLQPNQILPKVAVLPQHDKVMVQFYTILESANLIRATDRGFVRTDTPVYTVTSNELHQQIINLYPQHASEHNLLKTTGSRLADCLTGVADPLALLFQDANARQLMEDVYTNAPMFNAATRHVAQYLVKLLNLLDTSREIRILEIGAGTGATTKILLRQLTAVPGLRFQYTFTDLSSSLLRLGRNKFSHYNFMKYQVLNVEQTPGSEMLGQYDIIISSNCIHATHNLVKSCTNIRMLLRPGGILCLIELTRNLFWFDLVFGLLEGWWLFDDGRKHALASEHVWKDSLCQSGFQWVDWSCNDSQESKTLRLIVASPTPAISLDNAVESTTHLPKQETVVYGEEGGVQLCADIIYPEGLQPVGSRRPIALMIHGGGHIMLSRRDVRPKQTKMLLESGFLPVSIDYRLCPEVSLLEGPMHDVREALRWARYILPKVTLSRPDIQPDGEQVVAVGWSTGGHLAMSLAWTAPQAGISPPDAVLAFYCPTDYEDQFWSKENFPYGTDSSSLGLTYNLWEGLRETPITAYNPPASKKPLGGWMSPGDARSRIALHMNWKGQTLPVLLHGGHYWATRKRDGDSEAASPPPAAEKVQAVSPLAQIRDGCYKSPTFLIHGTLDDLIPVEQAQRTYKKLISQGIEAELRVVEKGLHLFDIYPWYEENREAFEAVLDGYQFLRDHVQL